MSIFLREVNAGDMERILAWRNDPLTRENSFNKEEISLSDHQKWFAGKMADENCLFYIMMDHDMPIGQLRIDRQDDIGEISYMIAPEARGKGYGSKILTLAQEIAKGEVKVLLGLVEKQNTASCKCFEKNGFAEFDGGDMICFIRSL